LLFKPGYPGKVRRNTQIRLLNELKSNKEQLKLGKALFDSMRAEFSYIFG
jgi:hypothetical protein